MSDEAALLAQILADPADDTVRLVLADWLDENGQPERAEFIRVQIRLAPLNRVSCPNGHSWAVTQRQYRASAVPCPTCRLEVPFRLAAGPGDAREREGLLWSRFSDLWALPLAVLFGFPDTPEVPAPGGPVTPRFHHICPQSAYVMGRRLEWEFCRGFIETVSCAAADWFVHGDAARAAFPIRAVQLTTLPTGAETGSANLTQPADRAAVQRVLEGRWPGVTFELPA